MPTLTLTLTPQNLKDLADKINDAIEDYSVNLHKQEPRTHLGISEIGGSCTRQTWYKFRWMKFEEFDGRMLRLFNRGHREEERFISYLEGIGCKVERFDENGKQFKVKGVMGHYGGSCDGRIITPWYPDIKMLVEFKTHNTKSFTNYIENDKQLHKAKPKHLDQMNGYGYMMQLEYGVYFPENKNDDDINVTVVKLDWQRGAELERRAADIITSQEPPTKISDNPSYYECRYCTFKGICHEGEMPVKNCRSCRLCKPVENAEWYCSRYNANIPKEWISVGCKDGWVPL